jgi:lipid II:glycine glycyltransferase (peptidoglycan interpeptide bridge formation enzyme)
LIDSGLGRLYFAYEEREPIAGAFFVGYNKCSYYMLSSAKEKGLQKAAPDLILWTSMKDYQQGGYKVFNFGGLSERELNGDPLEKSGLFHFKKRFSTDEFLCYKGMLILRPVLYKIFDSLKRIKSKLLA